MEYTLTSGSYQTETGAAVSVMKGNADEPVSVCFFKERFPFFRVNELGNRALLRMLNLPSSAMVEVLDLIVHLPLSLPLSLSLLQPLPPSLPSFFPDPGEIRKCLDGAVAHPGRRRHIF